MDKDQNYFFFFEAEIKGRSTTSNCLVHNLYQFCLRKQPFTVGLLDLG